MPRDKKWLLTVRIVWNIYVNCVGKFQSSSVQPAFKGTYLLTYSMEQSPS